VTAVCAPMALRACGVQFLQTVCGRGVCTSRARVVSVCVVAGAARAGANPGRCGRIAANARAGVHLRHVCAAAVGREHRGGSRAVLESRGMLQRV
jgi:hypothetical protein